MCSCRAEALDVPHTMPGPPGEEGCFVGVGDRAAERLVHVLSQWCLRGRGIESVGFNPFEA